MRTLLVIPLFASFLYQQGCDIASMLKARPEQVQQKVAEGIRPYFPHAEAQVFPEQRTIVAISCAENIGEPVIAQVANYLKNSPEVGQLRQLRQWGSVIGAPSYKYLRLGFERSFIELDVDSGAIRTVPTDEAYIAGYRRNCSNLTDVAVNSPDAAYSYIGVFDIRVTDGKQSRTVRVLDSLGVYSPSGFESHRDAEVRTRESLIRAQFREQNIDVLEFSLDHAEKVEIPASISSQQGVVGN